jgi:hypothetical protein
MTSSEVIALIEAAFPTQPLPDTTLRQGQLADQSIRRCITEEEWDAEGAKDRGVTWSEVQDDELMACDAALAHLAEGSFVYYLPAFLRFATTHIAEPFGPGSNTTGFAVFAVTHRSPYNLARLNKLNDAQTDAVTAFLRFVRDNGEMRSSDAAEALREYWETPECKRKTLIYVP